MIITLNGQNADWSECCLLFLDLRFKELLQPNESKVNPHPPSQIKEPLRQRQNSVFVFASEILRPHVQWNGASSERHLIVCMCFPDRDNANSCGFCDALCHESEGFFYLTQYAQTRTAKKKIFHLYTSFLQGHEMMPCKAVGTLMLIEKLITEQIHFKELLKHYLSTF